MKRINLILAWLAKFRDYDDLILAVFLIVVVSMLIIPMPTVLVDTLLACSLGISVVILLIAISISSVLSFSVFPSLLLFTTLFRLSLNVTTTRLILLNADAGEVVHTFGNFVVAGNYVVGAVIFLILTIVQFIVISKGSERVAEVGARFSLDAMPGKQMSIDADVRNGLINADEANERRRVLSMSSQLYGAMDGAMKFVKGDAIAGIIIAIVNIVGGLAIGMTQKGMPLKEALETYTILTIGEGLVAQIPALLMSMTAGIVVTRVNDSDSNPSLGSEIHTQFAAQPKAIMAGGGVLFLFALIPGFPKIQFLILAIIVGGVGWYHYKKEMRESATKDGSLLDTFPAVDSKLKKGSGTSKKETSQDEFSITMPILVDANEDIKEVIDAELLNNQIVMVRKSLYQDLGVQFPGINLSFSNDLEPHQYKISLHEIPVSDGYLPSNKILVREDEATLDALSIPFETGVSFLPGLQTIWVENWYKDQLSEAEIAYLEPAQILSWHLAHLLKRHAAEFLGIQEVKRLCKLMESQYPDLVQELQRALSSRNISDILQRLVQEGISIRNLRTIFEALVEWGVKEKDPVMLTEYVRMALKRHISYLYSSGQNVLSVYLVDSEIEELIRNSVRQTSSGSYLALDPGESEKIRDAIKREVGESNTAASKSVILTAIDIRRYLRKLIEQEFYELPVLSHQELSHEINIQPIGRLTL